MVLSYYSPKQLSVLHHLPFLPLFSFLKPPNFYLITPFFFWGGWGAHLTYISSTYNANQFLLLEKPPSLGFPGTNFPTIDNRSLNLLVDFSCLNY